MNSLLCATVLITVLGVLTSANPVLKDSSSIKFDDALRDRLLETHSTVKVKPLIHIRSQRSAQMDPNKHNIYVQGNHDRRAGTNIYVQGQTRVWQSPNRLNEVRVQGTYGQHFGGPGGRSPPSFGGGISYTRRF